MQLGLIGLGRMGGNMAKRWLAAGHSCVAFARNTSAIDELAKHGGVGADSIADLVAKLEPPRAVWIMIPAGAVDAVIDELAAELAAGDVIIDGGNSHYVDDLRRAKQLGERQLHYVDVGVSGGVWGLTNGYCQMIGGEQAVVNRLDPLFAALAPGAQNTSGKPETTAPQGYLHCGPNGAGHFVKMVHNGIEYGLMAAYAEGFNVLSHANVGLAGRHVDAETSPLKAPELFGYELDLAAIAEVWRHGSVVRSWLLDLAANALAKDPALDGFVGRVADSGEGRWTVSAAIEAGVPTPVLATALFERFASRQEAEFANRLLSAMRLEFGGHTERAADGPGGATKQ
jgi:6-phosphogluconate dehydrogenase